MPVKTTVIGAYPKPSYLPVPDWFRLKAAAKGHSTKPTVAYDEFLRQAPKDLNQLLQRALKDVMNDQDQAGIDIPTDGEIPRENYIYYHCRRLGGFDFNKLTDKVMRCGSWRAEVPTITSEVRFTESFLDADYKKAQTFTKKPVKITIPGPLTITDSTADAFYGDESKLGAALADAINKEIHALIKAGCTQVQVDEPLFARMPDKAAAFGLDNLDRCFHNVPKNITCSTHICCGYPDRVDNENYAKADRSVYMQLVPAFEKTRIDCISIEDAHRHNDLSLLEEFRTKSVIFGVIAIARSKIESVEEIRERLKAALQHIDASRLIAAPDCGLGMLSRETCIQKLTNMCEAARTV